MSHTDRIVALIDMDCFYCQVEEKLNPDLAGKPIAVVQYNQWRGGGIIAVNYLARDKGVTRQMRGDEAKEKCPDIQLARVPQVRGKADLTKYREAGKQVAEVLKSFTNLLERASIDEAYLDLTEAVNTELKNGFPIISFQDVCNTFVVGAETADFVANIHQNRSSGFYDDDLKLLVGGVIVERIRAEVFKKTGYVCSAGIAHNKILAKLVCGLHKPNKQTILPQGAVPGMFATLPIRKIKSLGGKFGNTLSESLNINYIGELLKFSEKELVQRFDEKTGRWLYNISRGIDKDPVQVKLISKSIGCCKRFPGRTSLCEKDEVEHWMRELSGEMADRLDEDLRDNKRKGRLITISFSQETKQVEVSNTRAVALKSYEMEKICTQALEVINKFCRKPDGSYHLTFLGLSVGNFEDIKNVKTITSYFGKVNKTQQISKGSEKETKANSNIQSFFGNTVNKENKIQENISEDRDMDLASDEIKECDDKSIYSDSTLELEENPDDLIFYNPNSSADTNESFNKNINESNNSTNNKNENSDSNILQGECSTSTANSPNCQITNINIPESPILGLRHQKIIYDENSSSDEVDRNFDTSKIFEGHYDSSEEELEGENMPIDDQCNIELTEKCPECDEIIPIVDIVSHMDYHLALRLSQEVNTTSETNVSVSKKQSSQTNDKKPPSKKRKLCDSVGNSITSFLQKQEMDSGENSELCSKCNKRIKLVDVSTHADYHAAKELHLELNSSSAENNSVNVKLSSSITTNTKVVEKKKRNVSTIATFFKQMDPSL